MCSPMPGEQVWVYDICESEFVVLLFVLSVLSNDFPESEEQTGRIHVKLSLCHGTGKKPATNLINMKIKLK